MVFTASSVGQNNAALYTPKKSALTARNGNKSLLVQAQARKKSEGNGDPKRAKKAEPKLTPQQMASAAKTEAAERVAAMAASLISEKDLEALKVKAQETFQAFDLGNLEEYQQKFNALTDQVAEVIKDERVKQGAASYLKNGVEAHVSALQIATEMVDTAAKVATGKSSLKEGTSTVVDKLFKFQKLGFQTSINMMKTTANLLLGKGKPADASKNETPKE